MGLKIKLCKNVCSKLDGEGIKVLYKFISLGAGVVHMLVPVSGSYVSGRELSRNMLSVGMSNDSQ